MLIKWSGKAVSANKRLLWNPKLKRNVPNQEYKTFKDSMSWEILRSANGESYGKSPVDVELDLNLNNRMDSDAVIKPCLDALQLSGLIKNDSQVRDITIKRQRREGKGLDEIVFNVCQVEVEDKK